MQFHQLKQFAPGERRHATSVQLCPSPLLGRRRFMLGTAAAFAVGCLPAVANVPVLYDWDAAPPMDDKLSFIEWMVRNRGEEAGFLAQPGTGSGRRSPAATSGTSATCGHFF